MRVGQLDLLWQVLEGQGYEVIGPTLRDGAIIFDRLQTPEELPKGWHDEQSPGQYRLRAGSEESYFGFSSSPQSWKSYLFPPKERLFSATKVDGRLVLSPSQEPAPQRAFLGVRACDLAAIRLQDKIFLEGSFVDAGYQERRRASLLIGVQCSSASATCFCASAGTGPALAPGFDLLLSEHFSPQASAESGKEHFFLIQSGSTKGHAILSLLKDRCQLTEATQMEAEFPAEQAQKVAEQQVRRIDLRASADILKNAFDHANWETVAEKCLNCANCTMVCPSCFCSTVEDTSDLSGDHAERWRRWDSCFTLDHSHIHGGSVRVSTKSRYRQWLTHKISTWWEQFDSSGCVGCGRCITWCPVGIDLTEVIKGFSKRGDDAK